MYTLPNPEGFMDPEIDRIARLGHGKLKYHDASRKLHNYVHKEGKTFPVPVSTCKLPVKDKKTAGEVDVLWPVLRLQSWLQTLFECGGAEIMTCTSPCSAASGIVFERWMQHTQYIQNPRKIFQ